MYIVEISRQSVDLRATMIQIKTWVRDHRVEPRSVELAFLRDREIRCRLQFENLSDALAVARFFDGEAFPERDIPDALAA
jgi:hypothetical protein